MTDFRRVVNKAKQIRVLGGSSHCELGCVELRVTDPGVIDGFGLAKEIELHMNLRDAYAVKAALGRAIMAEEDADR